VRGRIGRASIALGACLLLAACGGDGSTADPTPIATVAPTLETTHQAVVPLEIADPVWASGIDPADGSPLDTLEWVATDTDAIYAVFETGPIAAGTAFDVSWTMNDVVVPGLDPTLQIRADTPSGWIEFHLERTSELPWPSGMLAIELSVNGEVVASGSIELRD
jgi:hypothetical protein